MLFNSITYFYFFILVFLVYWWLIRRNLRLQNLFLFIASYCFYGWWDVRFLALIFISSLVDFVVGSVRKIPFANGYEYFLFHESSLYSN